MTVCPWRVAVCATAIAAASCGRPPTDIVATTTEDVGPYNVVKASADNTLTATVCVADPGHAEAVAGRIVQQLANHNFESITLDLIGPPRSEGSQALRAVWTPGDGLRAGKTARSEAGACGP